MILDRKEKDVMVTKDLLNAELQQQFDMFQRTLDAWFDEFGRSLKALLHYNMDEITRIVRLKQRYETQYNIFTHFDERKKEFNEIINSFVRLNVHYKAEGDQQYQAYLEIMKIATEESSLIDAYLLMPIQAHAERAYCKIQEAKKQIKKIKYPQ